MKTLIVYLIMSVLAPLGCQPSTNSVSKPDIETWAFVGVHPDDINAQAKANTMAKIAGIDATFGPALPPDWSTYSPAFPGERYINPEGYLRLTVINANAGMKTIVYDARIWSENQNVRQEAINFWLPHISWIRAWDMGDEFDPETEDWKILVERWKIVEEHITPVTGVGPFTNNLGGSVFLDAALRDMPSQASHYSFDAYTEDDHGNPIGIYETARYGNGRVRHLMCAVNALEHSIYRPSSDKLTMQMQKAQEVGCDSFLIFGGDLPWNTPGFDTPSLVDADGSPTPLAWAVAQGAA